MKIRVLLRVVTVFVCLSIRLLRADDAASQGNADFEKFLLQNHYGPVLTQGDENQQFIDARINGQSVHLLIDSGASETVLTRHCAERLGLKLQDTGKANTGVGGKLHGTTLVAQLGSFTINGWAINRLSVIYVLPGDGGLQADGLFGFDCLHLNSAIMVVGGAGILIRPGIMSEPPSVDAYLRKVGFKPVPLQVSQNRLLASGSLNGHPLHAQIDCGAVYSIFNLDYVRHFDINTSFRAGTMVGADGREMAIQQFTPDSMTLGPYQAPKELLLAGENGGMRGTGVDALVGFDFLSTRRAVLDTGSATLWLK